MRGKRSWVQQAKELKPGDICQPPADADQDTLLAAAGAMNSGAMQRICLQNRLQLNKQYCDYLPQEINNKILEYLSHRDCA